MAFDFLFKLLNAVADEERLFQMGIEQLKVVDVVMIEFTHFMRTLKAGHHHTVLLLKK